jgi:FtsZ-interacting cell division protein ZipA
MKRALIISIVLVVVALVFVGLFVLGDYLNKESVSEENKESDKNQDKDKDKDNATNETVQNGDELEDIDEIMEECERLGCESESVYIGSKNSDKFYKCNCRWAETISLENIVCFKTAQEALDDNRTESKC